MSNALTLAAPKTQTLEGEAPHHSTWLLSHLHVHSGEGGGAGSFDPTVVLVNIFSPLFSSSHNAEQVKATRLVISS